MSEENGIILQREKEEQLLIYISIDQLKKTASIIFNTDPFISFDGIFAGSIFSSSNIHFIFFQYSVHVCFVIKKS